MSNQSASMSGSQNPETCWQLIDQGAQVIDVRNPDEFASGHLPSAINVPLTEIAQWLSNLTDKQQQFVVYCGAGIRAQKGCDVLNNEGFMCVVNGGALKDLVCCQPK
ncbi:rhodanese-like domain-containing protein [Shewanella donghaensis]|uniref:rhodanese-like domain-containing protein n=1 Tax=Shewanella donghaensis TaxID=238836 RepID=UPI0011827138|nr:rhodanese-like domain-containing protein [Shewanella donghaensis]